MQQFLIFFLTLCPWQKGAEHNNGEAGMTGSAGKSKENHVLTKKIN